LERYLYLGKLLCSSLLTLQHYHWGTVIRFAFPTWYKWTTAGIELSRWALRQWSTTTAQSHSAPQDMFGLISPLKLANSGAEGQSPFAYSQILSTLGYNFKTVITFLDEGKCWYHCLIKEVRAPNFSRLRACGHNESRIICQCSARNCITPLVHMARSSDFRYWDMHIMQLLKVIGVNFEQNSPRT